MREGLYDERVDVSRTGTRPADPAAGRPWKAFTLLVVTYFITIVNVALPTIGRELRWRSIFFFDVPIGVAALVLVPRMVPAGNEQSFSGSGPRRYDVLGAVSVTASLLVLVYAPRLVMVFGMALIGAGMLWAALCLPNQAPADGSFWRDLAGPFFVAGMGTAFTFIPTSIGALAGVAERDAGVRPERPGRHPGRLRLDPPGAPTLTD